MCSSPTAAAGHEGEALSSLLTSVLEAIKLECGAVLQVGGDGVGGARLGYWAEFVASQDSQRKALTRDPTALPPNPGQPVDSGHAEDIRLPRQLAPGGGAIRPCGGLARWGIISM